MGIPCHKIRTMKDGRAKRPRESSVLDNASDLPIGMDIISNSNSNNDDCSNSSNNNSSNRNGSMMQNDEEDNDDDDNSYNKMELDESSGRSPSSQCENDIHKQSFPKQVTDDSCESEDTEKEKSSNECCSSEINSRYPRYQVQEQEQKLQKQKQHGTTTTSSQVNNNYNYNGTTGSDFVRGGSIMNRIESKMDEEEEDGNDQQSLIKSKPTLPQHERIQEVDPLDISYRCTPACLRTKDMLLSRLSMVAPTGRIQLIDLSRRGLGKEDAELICTTLRCNPQIAILKLCYNNFGDKGTSIIASGCAKEGRHHQNLTVLDLGFNCVGDEGCTALSLHTVVGNHTLRNLFLSGNHITQKGAMALASAILHGCSLSRINLSSNNLGPDGINVLSQSIREVETRVKLLLQRQGGIKIGYNIKPVTIEELNVDNVSMLPRGFDALANMILTNSNLKTISLANNDLHDNDLALLSQSLTQNKEIPVESLVLSFNKFTCVGVECLMNAVWGSQTLKTIKLDNNNMQDRGAQLFSVVLGSIKLEVLDVSFNKISTVGVKAIMKSLSENDSLKRLALCGIPMDQNASKAVSYALAYNQSLQRLNIDSCSVGYSGQRHIVAGIVSNQYTQLQVVTGFPLAPITMTLGLPQLPKEWGNDRVLGFVRFMWSHWKSTKTVEPLKDIDKEKDLSRGPAPPSMVAASAKRAFGSLSKSEESRIAFQNELQNQIGDNPIVAPDTTILVRSRSGQNLQIPRWGEEQINEIVLDPEANNVQQDKLWNSSETDSFERSSCTGSSFLSFQNAPAFEVERRNRSLIWLRSHLQNLTEVGNLPFDDADLWRLHQYFFSPAYNADDNSDTEPLKSIHAAGEETKEKNNTDRSTTAPPPTPAPSEARKLNIGRAISFRTLGKAIKNAKATRPNKRSSDEEKMKFDQEPSAKRAKNSRPRIAYYPRVKDKLESKDSVQTLSLLRQLKYVETVMLEGKNVYTVREHDEVEFPNATDVEMALLDLL